MKRLALLLTILILVIPVGLSTAYAQAPDPITPPPPKDGAVSGTVVDTVEVTFTENGEVLGDGIKGRVVDINQTFFTGDSFSPTWTWTCRSSLDYYDHNTWEEVSGESGNEIDTYVYMLSVTGELFRSGNRLWNNTDIAYNARSVGTGYSPWYIGYDDFWKSKGTHTMKEASWSTPVTRTTEATRQF